MTEQDSQHVTGVRSKFWILLLLLWLFFATSLSRESSLYSVLLLTAALAGFLRPWQGFWGLLLVAPWIDGLTALILGESPWQPGSLKTVFFDALFWGVLAGMLLERSWRRGFRFFNPWTLCLTFVVVGSFLASQWMLWLEWGDGGAAYLQSLWTQMPLPLPEQPQHALRATLIYLALPAVPALVLDGPRPGIGFAWSWLGSALFLSLVGLGGWVWRADPSWPQMQSWMEDPHSFAGYLILSCFMAAALWTRISAGKSRWPVGLVGLLLLMTLLMTTSRTALIALLCGVALVVFQEGLRRLRPLLPVGLLVFLLVLGLLSLPPPQKAEASANYALFRALDSIRLALDPEGLLARFQTTRSALWQAGFEMALERPLTGIGPGLFYQNVNRYYPPALNSDRAWRPTAENAHNYYLQVLAELGFSGLVAFAFWLLFWIGPLVRDPGRFERWERILGAGLLAFLIHIGTGHPLVLVRHVLLFAGFLVWLRSGSPPPKPSNRMKTVLWIATSAYLALILLRVAIAPHVTRCPPRPEGEPRRIEYVFGFYTEEQTEGIRWRWMQSRGMICTCFPSDGGEVRLVFEASSRRRDRNLRIRHGGVEILEVAVPVQPIRVLTPAIPVSADRICLFLETTPRAQASPLQASDDRALSIRIENLDVVDR